MCRSGGVLERCVRERSQCVELPTLASSGLELLPHMVVTKVMATATGCKDKGEKDCHCGDSVCDGDGSDDDRGDEGDCGNHVGDGSFQAILQYSIKSGKYAS